jgi:hypothetical protein
VLEKTEKVPTLDSVGNVLIDLSAALSKHYILDDQGKKFQIPLLARYWLLESWEQLTEKQESSESGKIKEVWGKLFNTLYRGFFNANTKYLFNASRKSEALILQLGNFLESLMDIDESKNRCSFCLRDSNFKYKNIFTSEHSKQFRRKRSTKFFLES